MWADLVAWVQSAAGARVLQSVALPAVAILVAGLLAALIGRAAVRSAIARADRDQAAAAVAGLVEAARAVTEPDGRRRTARLRAESDVRVRLLPLRGAALAADWAGARTNELEQGAGDGPVEARLDDLRDRLVAWVADPRRAKRLFPSTVTSPARAESAPPQAAAPAEVEAPAAPAAEAEPVPDQAAEPAAAPESAAEEVRTADSGEGIPAWRRTRSAERLEQERAAARSAAAPAPDEEEDEALRTAPVSLQRAHRRPTIAITDVDDAVLGEQHQPARHARGDDAPSDAPAPEAPPAEPPAEAPADERDAADGEPAWLDRYDDEAHVTQNLQLRTPPPVSATSVRDRAPAGEGIVPRP